MRVTGLVSISFLLAALGITSPAAAQPGAAEPAAAGAPAPAPVAPSMPSAAPGAGPARAAVMPAALSYGSPSSREPQPVVVPKAPLSESTALALSLGGTAASWALMVAGGARENGGLAVFGFLGTFVAPSMGHWYRGAVGTRGMAFRALGLAAFVYGFVRWIEIECELDVPCHTPPEAYLMIGGLLLYAGGTIDDIVTAPLRVRQHNRRLQQVQLAPLVAPHAAGLSLGGRF